MGLASASPEVYFAGRAVYRDGELFNEEACEDKGVRKFLVNHFGFDPLQDEDAVDPQETQRIVD